jgi:hypothetical protein
MLGEQKKIRYRDKKKYKKKKWLSKRIIGADKLHVFK